MIRNTLLRGLGLATLIAAAAACQGTDEGVEDLRDERGADILAHLAALSDAQVLQIDSAAIPRFVMGNLGKVQVASALEETDFAAALAAIAPVFRASPEELVLRRARTDEIGDQHFRFSQKKNGLRVIGAELVVHVRDGVVIGTNGNARADLPAPEAPAIDEADARRLARDGTEAADVAVGGEVELAYHASGERLDLVYAVEVTGTLEDGTPLRDTVLVNALDGSIALRMPHIHEAKNRKVYSANNGQTQPGTLIRSEGQAPVSDAIVNSNYDRLGSVYDCYQTLFARDSFDNAGAALISTVHYGVNYVNAYWDGTQMVYGDGDGSTASSLATSMDVTGHELTHAVTEKESNLVYQGESGGLNEAMSDIFGNVCEWHRDGQVVSANTWKVGEDVSTPGTAGDALRYMNDPVLDGVSNDHYADYTSSTDVHYSSGIANLAFYLLSQGGSHPRGQGTGTVTGIGILKAAKIFYKANADILTANASFEDAKTATVTAAQQLGYTAAEQDAVKKAWEIVGVGLPIVTTPIQNNVPVSNLSGTAGSKAYYTLTVPAGATSLSFATSGGSGDVDLYVKFGSAPTMTSYDCRPYAGGNAESCPIPSAQGGTYYVMLHGYSAYSGVTLTGSYTGGVSSGHLVINEVEYDNVGTDSAEYVEIYNPTSASVSLSNYSLVLINGSTNASYSTVSLSAAGTLGAGQYLVVGASTVTVPATAKRINWTGSDKIQNDMEGVALVSGSTVVDKLSYEGAITAASIPGVGTVSLVEGTALASATADSNTVVRSLGRLPNGSDTDNANTDWKALTANSAGAANQ